MRGEIRCNIKIGACACPYPCPCSCLSKRCQMIKLGTTRRNIGLCVYHMYFVFSYTYLFICMSLCNAYIKRRRVIAKQQIKPATTTTITTNTSKKKTNFLLASFCLKHTQQNLNKNNRMSIGHILAKYTRDAVSICGLNLKTVSDFCSIKKGLRNNHTR